MNHFSSIVLALCLMTAPAVARESTADDLVRHGDSLMQQSRDALDTSRYVPAREAYEQALALDPDHPAAMLGLAWVFNSQHQFDVGTRWCRAALALNENLPEAHALLGDAALEVGDYDAALGHYQRALNLRPDLASYSRAAQVLWIIGRPERGIALMRAAVAVGGAHAENRAWCAAQLALMLWETGDLAGADALLRTALARAPQNAHLLHAASRIHASRGDLPAAIASCRASIAAAPLHDALADLVELYLASGQRTEALRQMARVLEFQATQHVHTGATPPPTDSAQPHFHGNTQLARFLADHGQSLDLALGEAEAAVAVGPNVTVLDTLAWCYHQLGRHEEAVKTMDRALQWNTPGATLHFHAGMIYAGAGDSARAREHLERVLQLNPKFHPRFAAMAAEALSREIAVGP